MNSSLTPPKAKGHREPTIALINVVFLMLVFFMVAGTLSKTLPSELRLVSLEDVDQEALPPVLLIYNDGRVEFEGQPIEDPADWAVSRPDPVFDILADRAAPASAVLELANTLRQVPEARVRLISERVQQ